jgi:hypothetical protein
VGLQLAVGTVEGVHTSVLTRNPRVAVQHDDSAPDRRHVYADSTNQDSIATTEHTEAHTLAAIRDRSRTDTLLYQPPTDHEWGVAISGSVIRHPQRSAGQAAEHAPTKIEHHDTFTSLDGQRPHVRLRGAGKTSQRGEGRCAGARDEGKRPHCSKRSIGIPRESPM